MGIPPDEPGPASGPYYTAYTENEQGQIVIIASGHDFDEVSAEARAAIAYADDFARDRAMSTTSAAWALCAAAGATRPYEVEVYGRRYGVRDDASPDDVHKLDPRPVHDASTDLALAEGLGL